VTRWHALPPTAALESLSTTERGLDHEEAARRREEHGPNRLARIQAVSAWSVLVDQFRSIVVLLLVAAMVVALALGDVVEAVAIAGVLAINAAIGFVVELRARRAMDALLLYEAPTARVRRGDGVESVGADELVPGDVVELEEGDAVPADGRLLEVSGLRVNEAPLTGESLPVDKEVGALAEEDVPVGDRRPMVYSGTTVVAGRGTLLITGTGERTELGRIGALLAEVESGKTPLEERLDQLGRRLVWLTLAVAAVVVGVGIARGREISLMVETGIALAIAAVPEGLPAVATIALAVGLRRMARRNALVRRLAAVEALGATTVVCTDKTGTLTAGQMTAARVATVDRDLDVSGEGFAREGSFRQAGEDVEPNEHGWLRRLLAAAALTNRSSFPESGGDPLGDPTDAALLVLALKGGVDPERLLADAPRTDEMPFSTSERLSASMHASPDDHGTRRVYAKGAPGAILDRCSRWAGSDGDRPLDDEARAAVRDRNMRMAEAGLRVIALADGEGTKPEGLTFLGLAGIVDPPAAGVQETVHTLRTAGVRTVVITGDQRATAVAIARQLGTTGAQDGALDGREVSALSDAELVEASGRVGVFSRVSPEDKVRIVEALQERGEIVAMIGDGVNDAAALKKAAVGVAMGGRGTDVAKQAAAIVLTDDRFRTIEAAVEEGRVIFDNIRKFVFYLFSCNLAEVAVLLGASLVGAPLPLLPLQILWLNLVTDTFPALALALEPGDPGVMSRPPRDPEQSILSRRFTGSLAFYSLLITAVTLVAFSWALRTGGSERATTIAFMTLALAQLFHLGNARSPQPVIRPARALANPWAVGAVPLVLLLQFAAVYWPPLQRVLHTVPLGSEEWLVVVGLGALPAIVGQTIRFVRERRRGGISDT
jgi:P-type Ca2+ transporter type 2C